MLKFIHPNTIQKSKYLKTIIKLTRTKAFLNSPEINNIIHEKVTDSEKF